MRLSSSLLGAAIVLGLGTDISAQLSDLQPGRNFPTAAIQFGQGRSENIDLADVDNDGDFDVGISNGGDGGNQANRIYINNGGVQGGTVGTFSDGTGARFSGVPNDRSRDIEFADFDNDCDVDVYISNRGTSTENGQVSRAYINQGGRQFGSIGFFTEGTDGFWGDLDSVPLNREVGAQDGEGPWKDFSCDCDFGDLDNDGDLDLFHSSYGLNINGTEPHRIFLNNGDGRFDELFPWVNAGADINTHALDIDLADFDDDYDLDVFNASRDSQARVFRNNLPAGSTTWSGNPFTDVTQSALINQGATLSGSNNYEAEFADLDGDGDFDVWQKNYNGNTDRILINDGTITFTQVNQLIKGDPSVDENEIDFLDFDSDGDLDAFASNFSGTNWLYVGGVAQGLNPLGQGLYHRSGTTSGGSLYGNNELPSSGNGGTSLDADCADMDNDGDPDICLANDGNQNNRFYRNSLGVPDTFAPTIHQMTVQGNKSDGSDTVIFAQIRDNAAYYVIDYYDVDLVYELDGVNDCTGATAQNRVKMFAQRGQQFRGVIPGGLDGDITYWVELSDDAGNSTVSSTVTYNQSSSGVAPIRSLDRGTVGEKGAPFLTIDTTQVAGSPVVANLCDANDSSLAVVFFGLDPIPASFKQGCLWTIPVLFSISLFTNDGGTLWLEDSWPAGVSSGTQVTFQFGIADPSHPAGATLSNAVVTTAP